MTRRKYNRLTASVWAGVLLFAASTWSAAYGRVESYCAADGEAADTAQVDTLGTDVLISEDDRPWPQNVQSRIEGLLQDEMFETSVKELCDGTTVQFVPGDAEAIDFPGETDLITSCSTLQWFNDPGAFFTRCHQALVADGLLAFSTFGATNMHEIRQLTGHGLDYLSVEELQALLSPGFDILHAEEEVISLPFPTPQAVLKHLKQTGVTGTEKRIWTRSRLQSFCKEYTTRFSDAAGNVSLTYHPIYIIARKKTK